MVTPGVCPQLQGASFSRVLLAAVAGLTALQGLPGAHAAATHGKRPDLPGLIDTLCDNGIRKILIGEAHGAPENPLIVTEVLQGALSGNDREVSLYREVVAKDTSHLQWLEESVAPKADPAKKAQLLGEQVSQRGPMPAAQDTAKFTRVMLHENLSLQWMDLLRRTDMSRFISDRSDVSIASLGDAHALHEAASMNMVSTPWVDGGRVEPNPLAQALGLSKRQQVEMFDGFARAAKVAPTLFVETTRTLHMGRDIPNAQSREAFLKYFVGKGYVVAEVPWHKGNVTLIAPQSQLKTFEQLQTRHPTVGVHAEGASTPGDDKGTREL